MLARAALALLADPQDGVAALEVGWLGGAAVGDPDAWLSRRLLEVSRWRAAVAEAERKKERRPRRAAGLRGRPSRSPGFAAAGPAAERLSPAQALDLAIRTAGLPDLVRAWPEPGQRLANLEALRAEALAYEQLCDAQNSAATMLGLVAHLAALGDDTEAGKQAAPSSEDAVTVVTWHKAKGLEWPVVVLSHLDLARARSAFDVAVEGAPAVRLQPSARWALGPLVALALREDEQGSGPGRRGGGDARGPAGRALRPPRAAAAALRGLHPAPRSAGAGRAVLRQERTGDGGARPAPRRRRGRRSSRRRSRPQPGERSIGVGENAWPCQVRAALRPAAARGGAGAGGDPLVRGGASGRAAARAAQPLCRAAGGDGAHRVGRAAGRPEAARGHAGAGGAGRRRHPRLPGGRPARGARGPARPWRGGS